MLLVPPLPLEGDGQVRDLIALDDSRTWWDGTDGPELQHLCGRNRRPVGTGAQLERGSSLVHLRS